MTTQTRPISPSQRKQALIMFLVFATGLIAIPTYFTGVELAYKLFGVTTAAQVTGNHRESRRAGKHKSRTVYVIDYTFRKSGGLPHSLRDEIPEGFPINPIHVGDPVTVEYLPGFNSVSRIRGNRADLLKYWVIYGTVGTLCVGMAWLTWKRNDAKPTATQPVPTQPNSVQRAFTGEIGGGGIVGLVILGAILVGLSLLGVFGEAGAIVVFAVVGIGVLAFYMEMTTQATKQHSESMQTMARSLDLKFDPEGHEDLHASLKRFHLATLGPYSTMTNLMYGQRDGTDIAIFEYSFPRGKNNTVRQTVIWMQRRGTRMTEFALRPEGVWNQLGGWSGHGDINFTSHPDFSRDYLLRGDDEAAIRELFTDEVLNFYETHPELITEGEGNKLLLYREAVVVNPENLRTFLDEALTVRALLSPR